MPSVKLFACARGVSVDRFTDALSLFEVVDEIKLPAFPSLYPKLSLVLSAERQPGDPDVIHANLRVAVDDKLQGQQPIDLTFGQNKLTRNIVEFPAIILPAPGKLNFTVSSVEPPFETTCCVDLPAPTVQRPAEVRKATTQAKDQPAARNRNTAQRRAPRAKAASKRGH